MRRPKKCWNKKRRGGARSKSLKRPGIRQCAGVVSSVKIQEFSKAQVRATPTPGPAGQPPQMLSRIPGPCFNCSEMGHLKGNCPKWNNLYLWNPLKDDGVHCYVDVARQEIVPVKVCVNEYRKSGEPGASVDSI